MTRNLTTPALAVIAALAAAPALAQDAPSAATAPLMSTDGEEVGSVYIETTPSGFATVTLAASGMPEGNHAVHIHETGDCSAGDFSSAGGHLAGDMDHGVGVEGGPHPGDLPNVTVTESGDVNAQFFNDRLTMDMLFDDDGSAFIVHSGEDDYESQPSGDAGDRIACGVFEEATAGQQ